MKMTMMRNRCLPLAFAFLFGLVQAVAAQEKMTRQEYIDRYSDIAVRQMHTHGIPASITLAQGCLESGDGNSFLARKANNHFGIKCHDWKGPSVRRDDDARNECFRKYRNAEQSYADHSDFLRYRDRYAFLFDLDITDYKGWAHGLKKAGYATNPHYAQQLIKIIEDYRLYEFDTYGKNRNRRTRNYLPPSPSELERLQALEPVRKSRLYQYSAARKLYVRNGTAFILANEGDTWKSIAREYNLFTRELLRFNDLKRQTPISPGQTVYLERKRKRAHRHLELHVAEGGETYYDIAQRYAVRLESVCRFNRVSPEGSAAPGERIFLRRTKNE